MASHTLRIASFCSGVGGLDLGVKAALGGKARTVLYVEGEAFAAACLVARMQDKLLDSAPIWSDVKSLQSATWRGRVDCIIGGYPCQPFSVAGRRGGDGDARHLWPHFARHIDAIRPAFVFCENVPGHTTLGFQQVCEDLSRMGYAIEAGIFSAQECGAQHRRERLFFFAYANSRILRHAKSVDGQSGLQAELGDYGGKKSLADTNDVRCREGGPTTKILQRRDGLNGECLCDGPRKAIGGLGEPAYGPADLVDHIARGWSNDWEAGVPRVTQTQANRVDRLRALGNAVVPATAALAWKTLSAQMGLALQSEE